MLAYFRRLQKPLQIPSKFNMFHWQRVLGLAKLRFFQERQILNTNCNHEHAALEKFRPHELSSFPRFMSSLVPTAHECLYIMHSDMKISFKDYRFDPASEPPDQRMKKSYFLQEK